jgi:hypothetical protein
MHSAWPTLRPVVSQAFQKVTAHPNTRKALETKRFLEEDKRALLREIEAFEL